MSVLTFANVGHHLVSSCPDIRPSLPRVLLASHVLRSTRKEKRGAMRENISTFCAFTEVFRALLLKYRRILPTTHHTPPLDPRRAPLPAGRGETLTGGSYQRKEWNTMGTFKRLCAGLMAMAALTAIVGCGGGGGNSVPLTGSPGGTGKSALDVYVTDSFSDAYKQVMVTLYKIELTTDGTNFTTVYSNPSGLTLNLSSLSTTAELLSSVNVPSGSYTEARVTFSDHVTLVANNGTSTTVAVDPSAGVDSQGKVAITINRSEEHTSELQSRR